MPKTKIKPVVVEEKSKDELYKAQQAELARKAKAAKLTS